MPVIIPVNEGAILNSVFFGLYFLRTGSAQPPNCGKSQNGNPNAEVLELLEDELLLELLEDELLLELLEDDELLLDDRLLSELLNELLLDDNELLNELLNELPNEDELLIEIDLEPRDELLKLDFLERPPADKDSGF